MPCTVDFLIVCHARRIDAKNGTLALAVVCHNTIKAVFFMRRASPRSAGRQLSQTTPAPSLYPAGHPVLRNTAPRDCTAPPHDPGQQLARTTVVPSRSLRHAISHIMPIRLTPVLRENPHSVGVYGLWHPSPLGLVELIG